MEPVFACRRVKAQGAAVGESAVGAEVTGGGAERPTPPPTEVVSKVCGGAAEGVPENVGVMAVNSGDGPPRDAPTPAEMPRSGAPKRNDPAAGHASTGGGMCTGA